MISQGLSRLWVQSSNSVEGDEKLETVLNNFIDEYTIIGTGGVLHDGPIFLKSNFSNYLKDRKITDLSLKRSLEIKKRYLTGDGVLIESGFVKDLIRTDNIGFWKNFDYMMRGIYLEEFNRNNYIRLQSDREEKIENVEKYLNLQKVSWSK
jgi:hypothetical protein